MKYWNNLLRLGLMYVKITVAINYTTMLIFYEEIDHGDIFFKLPNDTELCD